MRPDLTRLACAAPVGTSPKRVAREPEGESAGGVELAGLAGHSTTSSFPWNDLPPELQSEVKRWFGSGEESGDVCSTVERWCRVNGAACGDANGAFWDDILERLAGVPRGSNVADESTERGWSKRKWFEELCAAYSDDGVFSDIVRASKRKRFLWHEFPNLTGGNSAWEDAERDFVRWMAFQAPPQTPHEVRLTTLLLSNAALALTNRFHQDNARTGRPRGVVPLLSAYPNWRGLILMLRAKLQAVHAIEWVQVKEGYEELLGESHSDGGRASPWEGLPQLQRDMLTHIPHCNKDVLLQQPLDRVTRVDWSDPMAAAEGMEDVNAAVELLKSGASFTGFGVVQPLHEGMQFGADCNPLWEWLWDQCERGAPVEVVETILPWIMWVEAPSTYRLRSFSRPGGHPPKMRPDTLVALCQATCLLFAQKSRQQTESGFTDPKLIQELFLTACSELAYKPKHLEAIVSTYLSGWDWYDRMERPWNMVRDRNLAHPRLSYAMWRMRDTMWPNWTPPDSGKGVQELPRSEEDAAARVLQAMRDPKRFQVLIDDIHAIGTYGNNYFPQLPSGLQGVGSWFGRHPRVDNELISAITEELGRPNRESDDDSEDDRPLSARRSA